MYKEGVILDLRFETSKGMLTIHQLFTLKKEQVATVVKNLKRKLKTDTDDDLAFLDENAPQVDKEDQLRFDIAKDVYLTLKSWEIDEKQAKDNKKYNQKVMELIQNKEDQELTQMSKEELLKLLK